MSTALLNVVLALVWVAATGRFTLADLLVGWLLGLGVLRILGPAVATGGYTARVGGLASLVVYFLREIVLSGIHVAAEVLTPWKLGREAIVAVPLDLESELGVAVLASLVTLTPGTLSIEIADDRRTLYVHAMFGEDPEEVRRSVKEGFERRVGRVLG